MKNVILSFVGLLMFVGCGCPEDADENGACHAIMAYGEVIKDVIDEGCEPGDENYLKTEIDYYFDPPDTNHICLGFEN